MINSKLNNKDIVKVTGGNIVGYSKTNKIFKLFYYETVDDMMAKLYAKNVGEVTVIEEGTDYVIVKSNNDTTLSKLNEFISKGYVSRNNKIINTFKITISDESRVFIGQ